RRQAEAMIRRPGADLGGATFEHRDVEGIDLDLNQDLGAPRGGRSGKPCKVRLRDGIGLTDESLEGPVTALLNARRYPGEGGGGCARHHAPPPTAGPLRGRG